LSPDGRYLISGSETGVPYVWDAETEDAFNDMDHLELKYLDLVSDIDWNPRYNMFACSGFGQDFPILVYVFQREYKEIEEIFFRYGKLTSAHEQIDLNDP
jgi:jouberin